MKGFEQIVVHIDQYGPENSISGVLNFKPEDVLCCLTPPKNSWTENTKSVFTYLRLRGNANPKAYLVKYEDLKAIMEKV